MLLHPIGVWIFSASLWSVFINGTVIIGTQKWTWHRLENLIAIFIHTYVLVYKVGILHAKMPGNTFNVGIR